MVDRLAIAKRLQADGRWVEAEPVKNRMIKEARQQGMDKEEAQAWAYSEVDRLYPPLPPLEGTLSPSALESAAASTSRPQCRAWAIFRLRGQSCRLTPACRPSSVGCSRTAWSWSRSCHRARPWSTWTEHEPGAVHGGARLARNFDPDLCQVYGRRGQR